MNNRSVTVSRKGVVMTVTFIHDGDTKRTMKIATNHINKIFDQLIMKLGMLDYGFIQETASPKKNRITAIIEDDEV